MKLVANLEIERIFFDENFFIYKILQQAPYVQVTDIFNKLYEKLVQTFKDSKEYNIKLVCDGYEKTLYLTNSYHLVSLVISVNNVNKILDSPEKEIDRIVNIFLDETNTSEIDYHIKLWKERLDKDKILC